MEATGDLWREISLVFEEVLERMPETREILLRERCRSEEVAQEVRRLLTEHERAGLFLACGTETGHGKELPHQTFAPDEMLAGRFRVLRLLGTGGMGEVYARGCPLRSGADQCNSDLASNYRRAVVRRGESLS
jgi:hypothetical protein